ncbi:MAG: 23S rRNA (guanosine(2251)-2'-O)-methyltransferase RlmB [Firmicutes bacterium]|nr:23S rRNA (guanosine(2251)-2'-O)-methyltransferase RlmB [Bacillota bacterium]
MAEEFIAGRNAVAEALKSGRPADMLFVAREEPGGPSGTPGSLGPLIALAKSQGVVVKDVKREKLEQLSGTSRHQGAVLSVAAAAYAELEELLASANAKRESPFLVLCDEIEDPHNLGAILRTAEAAGVHGVVVPRRRSAPLSQTVSRTSAGAVEHIPVARVSNLCAAMETLKARGLWIYGADMAGEPYDARPLGGPVALVIGSEGKGLGRLVKERCDALLALPMRGKINSLNASVAAGILMYEIVKHR